VLLTFDLILSHIIYQSRLGDSHNNVMYGTKDMIWTDNFLRALLFFRVLCVRFFIRMFLERRFKFE